MHFLFNISSLTISNKQVQMEARDSRTSCEPVCGSTYILTVCISADEKNVSLVCCAQVFGYKYIYLLHKIIQLS